MRIALIGDIHTYRLAVAPWRIFNKRFIGQVNLWFNRRFRFRRELLPPVWSKVASIKPDQLLFSGDVCTCAIWEEFADVAKMIRPLTDSIPALMIPGNHDRYIPSATDDKLMEQHLGHIMPIDYPHLQRLNQRWHLLALDSCFPQPLYAEGEIGTEQLQACRRYLAQIENDQSIMVMCHYPAVEIPHGLHEPPRHGLRDLRPLQQLLAECRRFTGPTIYLHGHVHRPWCQTGGHDGLGHVLDICAGAPCNAVKDYPKGQGFWELDLPDSLDEMPGVIHHFPSPSDDSASSWQQQCFQITESDDHQIQVQS
jgi:3',5'-cyclic AMP phosphodiesterase CpdA